MRQAGNEIKFLFLIFVLSSFLYLLKDTDSFHVDAILRVPLTEYFQPSPFNGTVED